MKMPIRTRLEYSILAKQAKKDISTAETITKKVLALTLYRTVLKMVQYQCR